jgi:tRNA threonylcarbamoyladenosine modification (KEOPS) complex  Pcc1 subunit
LVGERKRAPYEAVLRGRPAQGAAGRRESDALFKALSPESGRGLKGATVTVRKAGSGVVLRIEATNLRALRASVNSYLRWGGLAVDVARSAGGGPEEE